MTIREALQAIVDHAEEPALNYAVNYAQYGVGLDDSEELRVQCLYVLNNLAYWRGDVAHEVRETLKAYVKEHK